MKATFDADFSKLESEAAKSDAAMGKLVQSTEAVNTALGGMTTTQGKSASTTNSAVTAMRQFDGVLSSVGVNINTQIRAMDDLAAASGKTASQIGFVGTVGLVAGAAMAGWDLGRHIAEWTGMDNIVSRSASTLLGWGDVSAETAAAKADVLAKASATAGREITNLTEAMQINSQHAQEVADHFDAVANGIAKAEESSKRMRDGLIAYQDRMNKVNDAEDRITAARIKRNQEELQRFTDKVREIELGGDHAFSTLHSWYGEMARDQQHMNELADQNIKKLEESQRAAQQFLIDALNTARAIDAELAASPIGHGPTIPNGEGPAPIFVKPITVPSVFFGSSQNSNSTLRSFDDGGPTGRGGPALLHPNEFVVPRGGALVSSGGAVQITINVTQPLGTPTAIADAVADALAKQYRGRGVRSN